jgi:hypothetical protein
MILSESGTGNKEISTSFLKFTKKGSRLPFLALPSILGIFCCGTASNFVWPQVHSPYVSCLMSTDKEEYIESSISLEGKYPQFLLEGDQKQDIIVRFESDGPHKVVLADGAEDEIGGTLELHFSESTGKLAALNFPGAAQRWKLERFVDATYFVLFHPLY